MFAPCGSTPNRYVSSANQAGYLPLSCRQPSSSSANCILRSFYLRHLLLLTRHSCSHTHCSVRPSEERSPEREREKRRDGGTPRAAPGRVQRLLFPSWRGLTDLASQLISGCLCHKSLETAEGPT